MGPSPTPPRPGVVAGRALALARDVLAKFVALLLERGEEREAARFLKQHLMSWLPNFAQRVGQRAETPFYAALRPSRWRRVSSASAGCPRWPSCPG